MNEGEGTLAQPRTVTGMLGGQKAGGRNGFGQTKTTVIRGASTGVSRGQPTQGHRVAPAQVLRPATLHNAEVAEPEALATVTNLHDGRVKNAVVEGRPTVRHGHEQDLKMIAPLRTERVMVLNVGAALALRAFVTAGAPIHRGFRGVLNGAFLQAMARPVNEAAVEWGANSIAILMTPTIAPAIGRILSKRRPTGAVRDAVLSAIAAGFARGQDPMTELGGNVLPEEIVEGSFPPFQKDASGDARPGNHVTL